MNHRMFTENDMVEDKMFNLDNSSYCEDDLYIGNISVDESMRDDGPEMEYLMEDYDKMDNEIPRCMGCPGMSGIPCTMNMPYMENYQEKQPCKMMKENPIMQPNIQGQIMPYMVEIEEDDECDSDDVKAILEKMEKKNPEIFTFMSAYGIPYPIIKKALKNIIHLTLKYK